MWVGSGVFAKLFIFIMNNSKDEEEAGKCSMWVGSGVLGCLQNTAPVTLSRTQSRLNVSIILAKKTMITL